jgi:outer membrane lipoprotein LolB
MLRLSTAACCLVALSACVSTRPRPQLPADQWSMRIETLQHASAWTLQGRAAVAAGTQGWQAALDWRQDAASSELHLSGPLGIGAQVITQTPNGLSINGAAPSAAALAQLQDRLGFELPIDALRYWLLGVPDPNGTFDLQRNDQDRAQRLVQAGWSIDYDRYMAASGDILPAHIVLTRGDVRVRIVVDHWEMHP